MLISPSNQASTSYEPIPHTPTQLLLASLRSPIASLKELENLLLEVLTALGSVPPPFASASRVRTELRGSDVLQVIPTVQHIILNAILPAWLTPLRDAGHEQLAKELICPSKIKRAVDPLQASSDLETQCKVTTSALPILLAHLRTLDPKDSGPAALLEFCLSSLADINSLYPVDVIHRAVFSSYHGEDLRMDGRRTQEWEDYVRNVCSVPGRVANALQGRTNITCSRELEHGPYFSKVCVHGERLLFRLSQEPPKESLLQSYSHLLLKLLNLGVFPPTPPSLPSQPSFFSSTLSHIRRRLHLTNAFTTSSEAGYSLYSETWAAVVRFLPLTSQQIFLASLLGALDCQVGTDTSSTARRKVGDNAIVLRGLLGTLRGNKDDADMVGNEELWSAVTATVCSSARTWDLGIARATVCWIADPQDSGVDEAALEKLLDAIVALWTNPDYIRHALLSQHRYTSSLFLLIFSPFPKTSSVPERLAFSPPFVSSISKYIGHLDPSVRRCGMLVAEVVAARFGQKLKFDGWEGTDEGLDWARIMREWQPDWTTEGFRSAGGGVETDTPATPLTLDTDTAYDDLPNNPQAPPSAQYDSDDDSLIGYDSPDSSRTPSPTPSELAEIERDPTLRVGRTKPVPRPVYLAQLATLLRTDRNNEEGAAERIEVVITNVEALIRRKKGFGLELEENAVELTIALVGLHNNYELEGYDEKRQGALNALVECCPRKAAMTLVEQFFTNQYSTTQRFVILTALALGARALAGLPVPPSRVVQESIAFPSKMLPPALHRKYATPQEQDRARRLLPNAEKGQVQQLLHGIAGQAIERSRADTEDAVPEIVRERRLRVTPGRLGSTRPVAEVSASVPARLFHDADTSPSFADVAAEHFIVPLVNHMWLHLRDLDTRIPTRQGAGTGMILSAVVLAQYLGTLAVLMHAARHATAFLGVLAPEALQMSVALGSRRVEEAIGSGGGDGDGGVEGKEAAVLTAALEVALVTLDACVALDGGRVLGLERTALLLGVREWAGGVLEVVEGGRRIAGGGGAVEGRMAGAAAGVVVKAEQVTGRWGRSMVGL